MWQHMTVPGDQPGEAEYGSHLWPRDGKYNKNNNIISKVGVILTRLSCSSEKSHVVDAAHVHFKAAVLQNILKKY